MEWREGEPDEYGYYLATWIANWGSVVVSELHFNPSYAGKWQDIQAHTLDDPVPWAFGGSNIKTVLAWMPKPEPYKRGEK